MGKFIDLTGKRFGKLTVLYRASDHVTSSGKKFVRWHCLCDCGNEIEPFGNSLRQGNTTSCGHCFEDITGQKFGNLTAKYYDENYINKNGNLQPVWWCECDCGYSELIPVMKCHLKDGHTKSCGKCKHENLTGQMFGKWKVIKRVEDYIASNGNKYVQWLCECSCENHTKKILRASILKSGDSKSCGCLFDLKYDLSGEYGIGWTNNGEPFFFDKEDYDLIKDYTWRYDKNKYLYANCIRNGKRTTIKMHRLIMDVLDDNEWLIDHIKHITYDNRKSQLRLVTNSQNGMNTKLSSNNTTGYKGVTWDKERQKWVVYIKLDNKHIYIGRFDEIEEADSARRKAELKYHAEYNYIDSMNYC